MINFFAGIVHALPNQVSLAPDDQFNSLTSVTFEGLVELALTFILIIAAIVFFFMLVLGGIRWITSGGDKGKTETARNQITAALVGLVIVFASWAILQIVSTIFGINLLDNLTVPSLNGAAVGGTP